MGTRGQRPTERQLARLVEEMGEAGLDLRGTEPWHDIAVGEIDYALRPDIHERRVPSFGAFIEPTTDPDSWAAVTTLSAERRKLGSHSPEGARYYADGMSSWLLRRVDGDDEWVVFDRPAGSERDLVVLSEALGALVVQRHPSGIVRVVGRAGVFRWDGRAWQHQPLVSAWVDTVNGCALYGDRDGARDVAGVRGARPRLAGHRRHARLPPRRRLGVELRRTPGRTTATPRDAPGRPRAVASHPVADRRRGVVRRGRRAHPDRRAPGAERPTPSSRCRGLRGTRHTSARRYSFDDPTATVIVVSEDGPVTVLRHGDILGASAAVTQPPIPDPSVGALPSVERPGGGSPETRVPFNTRIRKTARSATEGGA